MTRVRAHLIAALTAGGLAFVLPVAAAQLGDRRSSESEINLTADKLTTSEGSNQIEAVGNVEIKREATTLKADEVRFNRTTQDIEAKGRVTVDDPEWKVKSADSIKLNMGQETGYIENGDLFLEQGHISMTGRRFEKFGGQTYHVDDGAFTTCLCESGPPSWKFSAEKMDLALDGVGTIKNGFFYVLDVPVFYLPYGYFPLNTERQTGLLFPTFGNSSKYGFRFAQPFFWAMSKSSDATVTFDIETRARFGFVGEYRTLFDKDSYFQIHSSYFNEMWRDDQKDAVVNRKIADPRIPDDRWSIIGSHRYTTPSDWLTFSDFAVYKDDLFTRELVDRFDLPGRQGSDLRRSRFGESRFGVFRNWGDSFLKGEWKFYQDFIQPDETTLQRTPQLTYWGRRFLGGFPLEFRWRADGVNYMRREGGDGLRLDLRPEVVLPFRLANHFYGGLSVAPRQTVYHLYTPVKSSDRNLSRELVEVRGNVATALNRVFDFNAFGLTRVKHVIEPELSYLFVPGVNQKNIPIMDDVDRINRRNVVTFALTNRLWGKTSSGVPAESDTGVELLNAGLLGDVRRMGSLRLALGYDIDKERKGGDSLTDLDFNLRLTPLTYLEVALDGGINPGPWQLSQTRLAFTLADPRPVLRRTLDPDFNRPNSIGFSYHYLRRGPNSFLADDANADVDAPLNCPDASDPRCSRKDTVGNIGANMLYHLTNNLLVNVISTYDARDSRFLGFRVFTKFLSFCECWTVTLGMRRSINPANTSFSFDFSLLGLGTNRSSLGR
ncbi:MAG TPA: LPS assembly protein LptD [Candidatus Binatia bacterium]|nr:LPS assembly protein LptD [Candidatus Binatia bacterium]